MKTSDFNYDLPQSQIAQTPVEPRDHSRMLVCARGSDACEHRHFYDLPAYLRAGDALVVNESRVIPARLLGEKAETHAAVEVLLLRRLSRDTWEALVKPGRRLNPETRVVFGGGKLTAILGERTQEGPREVRFQYEGTFEAVLDELGQMPLPPYIHERLQDPNRYQTVYARLDGSAAAPTAGLHFTPELLARVRAMGVTVVPVLLHVGLGTFRPVKEENAEDHPMHTEFCEVTQAAADTLNALRAAGGRIVCVGTTSVRTLETATSEDGVVRPFRGETGIFIMPGYRFRAVDALITNFHLPESTLLMLVSAFMGRENALACYRTAVAGGYRFFSFGDAMLILDK